MGPPGQPEARRLCFWGFPPFLALVQTVAVTVHLKDMNVVGLTIWLKSSPHGGANRDGRISLVGIDCTSHIHDSLITTKLAPHNP